ncbi:MAG: hypothetical protein RLY16_1773 [Bacteroidota bacterium]
MLTGKKILIGITGSIAAYKVPILVRLLVKAGAEVQIVMTQASATFVTPVTLSTLTRKPVFTQLTDADHNWANHVMLGRWADLMLIAPLSCNSLAKMSVGLCDNLLMAVYLSATCPIAIAPAMDEDMWLHPATQQHINTLLTRGNYVIPVQSGELASGLVGPGRMSEPEAIVEWINTYFTERQKLKGTRVLITAGPTYEAIDPVRFIGNRSSGKMGLALATAFFEQGAEVQLIIGPNHLTIPAGISVTRVETAEEMYQAAINAFEHCNIAIMSAAVADYTSADPKAEKIKKAGESLDLRLNKTKDILSTLGKIKTHQKLVGFALETNNEVENAQKKLYEKNADFIVLNSLRDSGVGFGADSNKITIFDKGGRRFDFTTKSKTEVAKDIIQIITQS